VLDVLRILISALAVCITVLVFPSGPTALASASKVQALVLALRVEALALALRFWPSLYHWLCAFVITCLLIPVLL